MYCNRDTYSILIEARPGGITGGLADSRVRETSAAVGLSVGGLLEAAPAGRLGVTAGGLVETTLGFGRLGVGPAPGGGFAGGLAGVPKLGLELPLQ